MRSGYTARRRAQLFIRALAAFVITVAAGVSTPALAQRQNAGSSPASNLGDLLFGKAQPDTRSGAPVPRLARFRADTGDTFVFELSPAGAAYLKYDDSGEVWALNPTNGPRGDTIYKNDVGEAMLRTTRMGGLTVFTQDRPSGIAAAFDGGASDLHNLLVAGPIVMFKVLVQSSFRATRFAGHRVEFEAKEMDPGSEAIFADAANLAAQAFARLDHRGRPGHDALQHCNKVAFLDGRPPGAKMVGDEMRITVTPDLGFAGRPSSLRISQVLFRR